MIMLRFTDMVVNWVLMGTSLQITIESEMKQGGLELHFFLQGILSMANAGPNTNGSQL